MDAKITLSFNASVIAEAKAYAKVKGISLSRLAEYMFSRMTNTQNEELYELPISNWVSDLSNGKAEYHHKNRSHKNLRDDYYDKFNSSKNMGMVAESKYKKNKKK